MHVDADDVGELRLFFEKCCCERAKLTADTEHQEALLAHDGNTTECRFLAECTALSTRTNAQTRELERSAREMLVQDGDS